MWESLVLPLSGMELVALIDFILNKMKLA